MANWTPPSTRRRCRPLRAAIPAWAGSSSSRRRSSASISNEPASSHTVVVRNDVLRSFPWVAVSMLRAFREAKECCYQRLSDPRQTALAWVQDLLEEQRALLGPDPWPYALDPNRAALSTLIRYSESQGLIPRAPAVEELFAENTLGESPRYVR